MADGHAQIVSTRRRHALHTTVADCVLRLKFLLAPPRYVRRSLQDAADGIRLMHGCRGANRRSDSLQQGSLEGAAAGARPSDVADAAAAER